MNRPVNHKYKHIRIIYPSGIVFDWNIDEETSGHLLDRIVQEEKAGSVIIDGELVKSGSCVYPDVVRPHLNDCKEFLKLLYRDDAFPMLTDEKYIDRFNKDYDASFIHDFNLIK